MAQKIGEFIQKKLRSKGLEDKEVAGFLNISPSTLRKNYPLDDLYISRVIEFCKLLGEDLIKEFYYSKEPLKSLRDKEVQEWENKIHQLRSERDTNEKTILRLEDHISTQQDLIATLKKEINRLEGNSKKRK